MVDQATFVRYVREAFARLDDPPYLSTHPLAPLLISSHSREPSEALRRALLDAVMRLCPPHRTRPASASWRRWRCMTLRYSDGWDIKQIARELLISDRQARRIHRLGVEAAAAVLWSTYLQMKETPDKVHGTRPSRTSAGLVAEAGATPREDIEDELARVLALSPEAPTSLVQVLKSAATTFRNLADSYRVQLDLSVARDVQTVTISEPVLRQILLLVLESAVQEAPGPRIHLAVENVPNFVKVSATLGAPPPGRKAQGSGAAEAATFFEAARRLTEANGGVLEVTRATDGSRCAVLLLPSTKMSTVLVIDDNPDIVDLFRRYLAGTQYRLIQARTAPSALSLAHELRPAVITLDVLMPGQDGWQILHQLRGDPATRPIPIIVCSILPEKPVALSLGAADFLAKPVSPQALLDALERCSSAPTP